MSAVELIIGEMYTILGRRLNTVSAGQDRSFSCSDYYVGMYLGEAKDPSEIFLGCLRVGEDMHAFFCRGQIYHVFGDNICVDSVRRIEDDS